MINRTILVGRLTKDPELKCTPSGVAVTTFTLAVNRTFTNQQGEREADYIHCQAWRKSAENVANYLRKGSLVGVDGRLQSRSYENADGKRVFVTEVVADSVQFLEPKKETQGHVQNPLAQQGNSSRTQNNNRPQQDHSNMRNQGFDYSNDPFAHSGNVELPGEEWPF